MVSFYNACKGAVEAEIVRTSTRRTKVFWQELYFSQEHFAGDESSSLPFVLKAKQRAPNNLKSAFDRVFSFLFLDDGFEPQMNKLWLATRSSLFKEMSNPRPGNRTESLYKKLEKTFYEQVEKWHKEYDQPVSFYMRVFCGLVCLTFDVQIEYCTPSLFQKESGETITRWEAVKTVPLHLVLARNNSGGAGSASSAQPSLSRSSRGERSSGRLNAARPDPRAVLATELFEAAKLGSDEVNLDFIKYGTKLIVQVKRGTKQQSEICGQLVHIESLTTSPKTLQDSSIFILPLFEPACPASLQKCDIDCIFKKLSSQEWEEKVTEVTSQLPSSLKIFHSFKVDCKGSASLNKKEIKSGKTFDMSYDSLESFQVLVQVFNGASHLVQDVKIRNKTIFSAGKDMKLQLELFDERNKPIRARGAPWTDEFLPVTDRDMRGQFFSPCSKKSDLDQVLVSCGVGTYVLKASVKYCGSNAAIQEHLEARDLSVDRKIRVLPGVLFLMYM